ncbi:hypothetical protein ACFSKU_05460 [Pontibacter silvestris]|uniref:Uncharacterized protein n=1 Tax=Pontibacter silvestris TaxID=2305183 RepID=A0ABW4WUG2_9BACT|nr:hypothetical protein [Pontibacter silvestris]MCC9136984.1 hypothetical protein [Pontibacter silvestris]
MENNSTNSLKNLVEEPSQVKDIMNDPEKGVDFYKTLPVKQKQYLVFAAAAGLVAYGIFLGKKGS